MKFMCSSYKEYRLLYRKVKLGRYYLSNSIQNILESMKIRYNEMPLPKFNKNFAAVEVIGSGAYGAPRSALIYSGNACYLFNCGESTQRICVEFKRKIGKLPHIFITYPSWKNCGGLLGMSLSLQFSSLKHFFVYGHPALESLYYATNRFVNLRKINGHTVNCYPGESFSDGYINIDYVHLNKYNSCDLAKNKSESDLAFSSPKSKGKEMSGSSGNESLESDDDVDYYAHLNRHKHKHKHQKRSHSEVPKKKSRTDSEYAISYICRTPSFTGSLLISKCVDLNVPYGPLLGKLKRGEDVILEDGKVVRSCDVTTPDTPGVVFIVIECPTEEYLDSLLKEPAFFKHQTGEISSDDIAAVVIHFTSSEIVKTTKYQEWINRFPESTKHLYINEDNKSLGCSALYRQQYKLNMLLPDLFPLLKTPPHPLPFTSADCAKTAECGNGHTIIKILDDEEHSEENEKIAETIQNENPTHKFVQKTWLACNGNNHIKGESLTYLPVLPAQIYDYSYSCTHEQQFFIKEALESEGFEDAFKNFKAEIKALNKKIGAHGSKYPKILFLGTGSSQPNKRRNSSGILLTISENSYILLDCGEGTLCQIVRFFGKDKAQEILMNLNTIYVSHLHVDHHLGLINILLERSKCFEKMSAQKSKSKFSSHESQDKHPKVFLLAPAQIDKWLKVYDRDFPENILQDIKIIPNSSLTNDASSNEHIKHCLQGLNLASIKTTTVDHCPNSFGVSLEHVDGWKITYSGDTRPCQELIELGNNSDLLIHEATMDDSMAKDAYRKLHSTISQAVEVGEKMNAKFIILTHFSQRYAHIPLFDNLKQNVGVAFDNLMVSLHQVQYLALLSKFLKFLYKEEHEKLEEKCKVNITVFHKPTADDVFDSEIVYQKKNKI